MKQLVRTDWQDERNHEELLGANLWSLQAFVLAYSHVDRFGPRFCLRCVFFSFGDSLLFRSRTERWKDRLFLIK